MRIEIDIPLELTNAEEAACAMHSFRNVVNVISMELQFLRRLVKDPDAFRPSLDLCQCLLDAFDDREKALGCVREMEDHKVLLQEDMKNTLASHPVDEEHRRPMEDALANLDGILDVVDVRVREILARHEAPGAWRALPAEDIEAGMRQVFEAIARNARGRYGIVFAPDEGGPTDYRIELEVRGGEDGTLYLPPVLVDCFRDLTANARKYSEPGSSIRASLVDTGEEVVLEVRDAGRGIPEEEIPEVVAFGVRGSNTRPEETQGGGFGLTKAYLVCRQHGGRMWIESAPGAGCAITLRLPRPPSA